jgi:hypothetical protein
MDRPVDFTVHDVLIENRAVGMALAAALADLMAQSALPSPHTTPAGSFANRIKFTFGVEFGRCKTDIDHRRPIWL